MLKDNPAYQLATEEGRYRLYIPGNTMSYHTSRLIQVTNQQIYNSAGATKDVLEEVMNAIIERCNLQKDVAALRTDVAAFANSIKYRLKYPVDELCGLRTGAMLAFLEYENEAGDTISEDPDKYDDFWTKKKMGLAMDNPALYTFFLSMGISSTPQYRELSDTLISSAYFLERKQTLASLLPDTAQPQTLSTTM